jgi:hypothetical protein
MKRNSFVITLAMLAMLVTASAVQAGPPSSPFSGSWIGHEPDPPAGDSSTVYLVVKGGDNPRIDYQDNWGTVCYQLDPAGDLWFSSSLTGTVSGNTMTGVFKSAKCGHLSISSWKGQSMAWWFSAGATIDPADDTLFDGVVTWSRV